MVATKASTCLWILSALSLCSLCRPCLSQHMPLEPCIPGTADAPSDPDFCIIPVSQFAIDVPPEATALRVDLTATQDLDLFLRHGSPVDVVNGQAVWDYWDFPPSRHEVALIEPPLLRPGTWFIAPGNCHSSTIRYTVRANWWVDGIPSLAVEPAALRFDTTPPGAVDEKSIVISNNGTDELVVCRASIDSDDFEVASPVPFTVGPASTTELRLAFRPQSAGTKRGMLVLDSNDGEAPLTTMRLAGVAREFVPMFRRGDADGVGGLALTDAVFVLNHLFLGQKGPSCDDAADTNDDGALNIADPLALLRFLFTGGPAPAAPGDTCGPDPTEDPLGCSDFASCAEA